ncbi:MAG TPA: amino acid adenylation domain-containing protein, partial [Longimicrobium sp.]|nr:amino acid adenylation domain-containing protein [Longimicrobium sp.]
GIAETLRGVAREEGATLFMALLAAFYTLLARYTGTADLVVGTPVANRGRSETEHLVGFFANMLALRTDLSGDPTFREALRRVRDTALGAYAHEELPFERLVEALVPERTLSRNEIFQVAFLLDESPVRPFRLPGMELTPVDADPDTAMFDLVLALARTDDGLTARLEYATALFDPPTIERMAEHLNVLLRGIAAEPDACISGLPLLMAGEAEALAAWGEGARDPHPASPVHRAFEAHARRAPYAVAVASEGRSLTYAELDARADRLARRLVRAGVERETRVAVLLERGPELVTALLAVLKAGGAYVPIDPTYPAERIAYMLEDSGAAALLTVRRLAPRTEVPILHVDEDGADEGPPPAVEVDPAGLAYVVYTSGSTGRPKGVAVPHHGVARLAAWHARAYAVEPGDRCTLVASPAFDASTWEVWGALAAGAALHVVPDALRADASALLEWMDAREIDFAFLPTPAAEGVLEAMERGASHPPHLRALLTGGDALRRRPAPGIRLVNHYGPTENSVVSTAGEVSAEGRGAPSIGRPVDNHRAAVLDARLMPVPAGVAGELYVAGEGVARGYLGRPGMTAERFLPDPVAEVPGGRMYRTGDRVRWLATGELEFLGRADEQVKVRGFRIEPGEVEAALAAHPALGAAVAAVWDDGTGERRLVAWFVAAEGADAPTAAELRRWMADRLPEHMIPSLFVALDELPLTPSGKVDRRALPRPEASHAAAEAEYVA